MERVCYLLKVRADRTADYRRRHAEVWPAQLEALRKSGWRNYSLFLRPDGLLVAYCEPDDFAEARAQLDSTTANARWQAEMTEYFELPVGERPDTGFERLEEVFHLD